MRPGSHITSAVSRVLRLQRGMTRATFAHVYANARARLCEYAFAYVCKRNIGETNTRMHRAPACGIVNDVSAGCRESRPRVERLLEQTLGRIWGTASPSLNAATESGAMRASGSRSRRNSCGSTHGRSEFRPRSKTAGYFDLTRAF